MCEFANHFLARDATLLRSSPIRRPDGNPEPFLRASVARESRKRRYGDGDDDEGVTSSKIVATYGRDFAYARARPRGACRTFGPSTRWRYTEELARRARHARVCARDASPVRIIARVYSRRRNNSDSSPLSKARTCIAAALNRRR